MGFKKITYSLPALKTLLETKNSCVYCIENCHRSLIILPAQLGNLKTSVHEYLSSKVTTCDPELQGIILSHKNVKVIDSVQLNDDGNYRLDYIADTYIFKPSVGSLLTGVVNKKSADHLGVLVHSVFNASIPRPRFEIGCPKAWAGTGLKTGQQVTFEVTKINFTSRLPFIKGKLIDVEEKYNEDGDSGIGGHESTEEGSSYKNNFENSILFNENGKRKKKKKLSSFGEAKATLDSRDKETSPSTSDSSAGTKNSSNLSELQSLLLNEAIATVSGKGTQSEVKKEKSKLDNSNIQEVEDSSKLGRKRKRETSLDLGKLVENQATPSPKIKKKKYSDTILNSESRLLEEIISKNKKKESMDNLKEIKSKDKKSSDYDVQTTIENLLSFATDSTNPKKKKKKKKSSLLREMEDEDSSLHIERNDADISLEKVKKKKKSSDNLDKSADLNTSLSLDDTVTRLSYSFNDIPAELESNDKKKKKKKKFLLSQEDRDDESSVVSELPMSSPNNLTKKEKNKSVPSQEGESNNFDHISELYSDSLRNHKRKEKKKNKSSLDKEFLQLQNNCITELLSSKQSDEIDTNQCTEKKKKKKSKHSDVGTESSCILESDDMPPPSSKAKIKKKKSVSFTDI